MFEGFGVQWFEAFAVFWRAKPHGLKLSVAWGLRSSIVPQPYTLKPKPVNL